MPIILTSSNTLQIYVGRLWIFHFFKNKCKQFSLYYIYIYLLDNFPRYLTCLKVCFRLLVIITILGYEDLPWSWGQLATNSQSDHICAWMGKIFSICRMVASNTNFRLTQWSFGVRVTIWQMATSTQIAIASNCKCVVYPQS